MPALHDLEQRVVEALGRRDASSLPIVGMGEVSVALGLTCDGKEWVAKRMARATPAQFAHHRQLIDDYIAQLTAVGIAVVDTCVVGLDDESGTVMAYVVQPRLDADSIGGAVLKAATPDPEHPLLAAIIGQLGAVTDRVSFDAQVTNYSWDGTTATLVDVGTPFMWDANGNSLLDMEPFRQMVPSLVWGPLRKELYAVIDRWKTPRNVGIDLVANLIREGLDGWIEPAIIALNASPHMGEPMSRVDAQAIFDEDLKTFPRVVRLQKLQRLWATHIRRNGYDFFVNTSYGDAGIS